MPYTPGTRLGPYEVLSPLGSGGMGEVWKAKDTRLDRFVAIKVLPEHLTENTDALARFEREAKAVAALNHPNITGLFDIGREGPTAFAVMELLEGESLRARLSHGPLSPRTAIDLATQMAHGLAAAHEKGVIHRDLKPDNLWITLEGRLKILDFGLAKQASVIRSGSGSLVPTEAMAAGALHTEEGMILGTIGYMSPEQVRGEAVDVRSDIFSFGVVLFEMVTGKRAFARDTSAETMVAILKEDPPELDATSKPIPPGLRRILDHCLEKVPGRRFHDAEDLAFALANLGSASDSAAPFTAPFAAPNRRTTGFWAGLVALALLAALGTGWKLGAGSRGSTGLGAFHQLNLRQEAILRAAFAPDGKTVVYSAAKEGNRPELFVVRPGTPEPQNLGLKDTHLLSLSSQGELAILTGAKYIRHRIFQGTLARLPLGGGAPREILENVREADWSPDGSQLAIIREVDGHDRLEFPIGTVLRKTSGYFSDLRFSPKGDGIAFFEHPFHWDDRGSVNLVDLKGQNRILAEGYEAEEGLAWAPDGREVFFAATLAGLDLTLYAVAPGGRPRIAFQGPGGLTMQDINKEGRWLVTRDDVPSGLMALIEGVERDLSWLDTTGKGVLSQDGKTIVFTEWGASAGANYAVGLRRTDGSPVVRLGEGGQPSLSRDGRWVLAVVPGPPAKLMIYPTGAGQSRQLDPGPIERYSRGQWFRDGTRVLFNGSETGRSIRGYVQALGGGPPRAVTPEGFRDALLSPDERLILARNPEGSHSILPLEGGDPRPVRGIDPHDTVIHWCADGRAILVFRDNDIPCRLEKVDLATGKRSLFKVIAPRDLTGVLNVSPTFVTDDQKSIAYEVFWHRSRLYVTEGHP